MQYRHIHSIRRSAGFTLLEMLAVIVLIGVIGAVVVTQVGKNMDKGKYGAGKAQLVTLSQKIENYALDNGSNWRIWWPSPRTRRTGRARMRRSPN